MKTKKTINVMLADFLYDNDKGPSYNVVPLNIAYLVSYAKKHCDDKFNFKLYRNADKFIEDFNNNAPSIVAFAQYIWNNDLSQGVLKWIKSSHPEILAISGGPMVGTSEKNVEKFLNANPLVDFCVPAYGEEGFLQILNKYIETKGNIVSMKNNPIDGVAFMSGEKLINTETNQLLVPANVDMETEIPSPYLTGLLDEFLEDGYSPMIQGMRGCPFKCTFCFASKLKIAKFSEKHVLSEIDYIYERTKSSALLFTDDNFGMYKRDVQIAKKIKESYDTIGIPNKILMYYSKKPTDTVLEVSKIMGDLTPFFISYQSRNEKTLEAIDRYNLEDDNTRKIIKLCRENSIYVASEMIFGLPYETKESFISGLEDLYKLDVDTIAVYHVKYFNGTGLATDESREECDIVTRHRFYEDNFQLLKTNTEYGDILACETDEVPVASSTYNLNDFLDIRMLGFWIELLFAKKVYYDVLKYIESYGIQPFYFIQKLIDAKNIPDSLRLVFNEIRDKYEGELHNTHDELKSAYEKIVKDDPEYKSIKVNLYYIYVLIYTDMRDILDSFVKKTIQEIGINKLSKSDYDNFIEPLDELFEYNSNQIIDIDSVDKVIVKNGNGNGSLSNEVLDLNQGSDNAQRYLLEGSKSTKMENNVSTENGLLNNNSVEFTYNFTDWKSQRYQENLNKFKTPAGIKYKFNPINLNQYKVFFNKVDYDMRPYVWHNYIISSNVMMVAKMDGGLLPGPLESANLPKINLTNLSKSDIFT